MKFVDMAETFHLPAVYLVDCPGFQIGLTEQAGTKRGRSGNECHVANYDAVVLNNSKERFWCSWRCPQNGRYCTRYDGLLDAGAPFH